MVPAPLVHINPDCRTAAVLAAHLKRSPPKFRQSARDARGEMPAQLPRPPPFRQCANSEQRRMQRCPLHAAPECWKGRGHMSAQSCAVVARSSSHASGCALQDGVEREGRARPLVQTEEHGCGAAGRKRGRGGLRAQPQNQGTTHPPVQGALVVDQAQKVVNVLLGAALAQAAAASSSCQAANGARRGHELGGGAGEPPCLAPACRQSSPGTSSPQEEDHQSGAKPMGHADVPPLLVRQGCPLLRRQVAAAAAAHKRARRSAVGVKHPQAPLLDPEASSAAGHRERCCSLGAPRRLPSALQLHAPRPCLSPPCGMHSN